MPTDCWPHGWPRKRIFNISSVVSHRLNTHEAGTELRGYLTKLLNGGPKGSPRNEVLLEGEREGDGGAAPLTPNRTPAAARGLFAFSPTAPGSLCRGPLSFFCFLRASSPPLPKRAACGLLFREKERGVHKWRGGFSKKSASRRANNWWESPHKAKKTKKRQKRQKKTKKEKKREKNSKKTAKNTTTGRLERPISRSEVGCLIH